MKHRPLLFLVLPLLLLAMTLFGVRSWNGSSDVASADVGTGTVHLEIDMVQDAGGAWCNPVQASTTHSAGQTYSVAICLSDVQTGKGPQSLQFDLLYNKQLNSCTDMEGGNVALDDNPNFLQASLGGSEGNWDCNLSNDPAGAPQCDRNVAGDAANLGRAFLFCQNSTDEPTLPVGSGTSAPIALVTFTAAFEGVDQLSLGYVEMVDSNLLTFLDCWPTGNRCFGATDTKTGEPVPTATNTSVPTSTSTPTVTSTPCPNGRCPTSTPTSRAQTKTPTPGPTNTPAPGEPTSSAPPPPPPPPPAGGQQPVVTPPSTGTGAGGVDWTIMLTWLMGGGAALSLFAGGLYLRRVANR